VRAGLEQPRGAHRAKHRTDHLEHRPVVDVLGAGEEGREALTPVPGAVDFSSDLRPRQY